MFSKFKSLFTDAPKTAQVNTIISPAPKTEENLYTNVPKQSDPKVALSTSPPTPPPHFGNEPSLKQSSSFDSNTFNFGEIKKGVGVIEEMMIAEEMWKSNVQLNAGYPLLTRYERLWSFIHENNIDLCREAERTDRQLHTVINHANGQFKALKDFEREISALPSLCDKLNKLTNLVDEINRRFSVMENLYAKLAEKKICDNVQQWKKRITDEALLHEDNRKQDLLKIEYKLRMEKERADRDEEIHLKLLELEVKRKKEFEERKKLNESKKINKAFDDAFNLDLHHYKTSQSLPQPIPKPETTLENLDLELNEEKGELNDFLDPSLLNKQNNNKNNNNNENDNENDVNNEREVNNNENNEIEKEEININDESKEDLVYTEEEQKELDPNLDIEVLPVIEEADAEYKELLALEMQNLTQITTPTSSADKSINDLLSQPLSQ